MWLEWDLEWEEKAEGLKERPINILGNTISGTSAKFETREMLNPVGTPGALR
jgi:hypothetical protein